MSRPWMPLYVADYLADTGHLTGAEHGAYMLLIMHYWANQGLPDDDGRLARIARMTDKQWARSKPVIAEFFSPGWKHGRIEFELTEAARISAAGRTGGVASGEARRGRKANDQATTVERPLNDRSNDQATKREALHSPSQPQKISEPNGSAVEVVGEDPRARLFREGKTILVSFGVNEKRCGSVIGQWLKAKNDPDGILGALKYARSNNVAEPVAYVSAIIHGKSRNGSSTMDAFDKLADREGGGEIPPSPEPIDITERSTRIS